MLLEKEFVLDGFWPLVRQVLSQSDMVWTAGISRVSAFIWCIVNVDIITCRYLLIILFGVGIVFHLAKNDYNRLKVENLILGVYDMTAFSHV